MFPGRPLHAVAPEVAHILLREDISGQLSLKGEYFVMIISLAKTSTALESHPTSERPLLRCGQGLCCRRCSPLGRLRLTFLPTTF